MVATSAELNSKKGGTGLSGSGRSIKAIQIKSRSRSNWLLVGPAGTGTSANGEWHISGDPRIGGQWPSIVWPVTSHGGADEGSVSREFTARRAVASETELVTSIISLSFEHDPIWGRALALPDGRTDHHATFWRISVEGALRYPWTWLAGGGEATAIWIPPGGTELTRAQEARVVELAKATFGHGSDTYLELLDRFSAAQPKTEPHYYLTLLGTHPEHRGHGIGMRLLAHNLALIDSEHMPAYLESTNPANDERYKGVGFEPIGEFSYPGGGPVVTTMWRPAR